MSFGSFMFVFTIAIVIVVGLIIISIYNKLFFLREKILDKFDYVSECLKDRTDIIRDIINIINEYHEEGLIVKLNNLCKELNDERVINNLILLIDKSDDIIDKALELDSIYKNLKNNKDYLKIRDKFNDNKSKVMYSMDIYNEEVHEYSNYKNQIVINIISKIFGFKDYSYYKK